MSFVFFYFFADQPVCFLKFKFCLMSKSNSNGSYKKWSVKCHFTSSILTPLNNIFTPMIDIKMRCYFNNSMFFR